MLSFRTLVSDLSARHRTVLEWFKGKRGSIITGWPNPFDGDPLVVARPKGIYKPAWTKYAVSIRETLGGKYPDREPVGRDDGTWIYGYHQESLSEQDSYTNRALERCIEERVPVGIIRQVDDSSPVTYRIEGIALVALRDGAMFFCEGFSGEGLVRVPSVQTEFDLAEGELHEEGPEIEDFSPSDDFEGRKYAYGNILRRRGQKRFRRRLMSAFDGRCAITGVRAPDVLEAAHIVPYAGPKTNHRSNGLLLRSDLHTLFDLGNVAVEPASLTVIVDDELQGTVYEKYDGERLSTPGNGVELSKEALRDHLQWSGLRSGQ